MVRSRMRGFWSVVVRDKLYSRKERNNLFESEGVGQQDLKKRLEDCRQALVSGPVVTFHGNNHG